MKNKVQFQKGYSFLEFMRDYGTEEQCRFHVSKSIAADIPVHPFFLRRIRDNSSSFRQEIKRKLTQRLL